MANEVILTLAKARCLPGADRPLGQCFSLIGDHQPEIHADDAPETPAGLTGPDRRIEGEQRRFGLCKFEVAVGAVVMRGITERFTGGRVGILHGVNQDAPLAVMQGMLHRFAQALAILGGELQAVLYHLNHVALSRLNPGVALLCQQLQHFVLCKVVRDAHRQAYVEALLQGQASVQIGQNAVRRVLAHRP